MKSQIKQVVPPAAPAPTTAGLADFDNFTKSAQFAVGAYSRLTRAFNSIHQYCSLKQLEEVESVLADFEKYERRRVDAAAKAAAQFEPQEAYDDDSEITKAQVSKHISMLLGSFPNANPADPEVYTMMLIEEVLAASPTVITLESACRSIRRTSKFLPTVSEALTAISEQRTLWAVRWTALECCDSAAEELREAIAAGKARLAATEAERARKKAKALPISVGDRVRNAKIGSGTVLELKPMVGGHFHFGVAFDDGSERHVAGPEFLERLVEGEEGFLPATETTAPEVTS